MKFGCGLWAPTHSRFDFLVFRPCEIEHYFKKLFYGAFIQSPFNGIVKAHSQTSDQQIGGMLCQFLHFWDGFVGMVQKCMTKLTFANDVASITGIGLCKVCGSFLEGSLNVF